MKVFLAGATGATGSELAKLLLRGGHDLRVVVRSVERLPASVRESDRVEVREAALLELGAEDLAGLVKDCDAVVSCLGHTLSFRGVFGKPRQLVTEAVGRLVAAAQENKPTRAVKFILMSSTGVRNRGENEVISVPQKAVIQLLRWLVPPHFDNERAADFLREDARGVCPALEWVAVRPDSLIDAESVTDYDVHASPIRSAIFDSGKTSRINVADFMARLVEDAELWAAWKHRMPVIYNR